MNDWTDIHMDALPPHRRVQNVYASLLLGVDSQDMAADLAFESVLPSVFTKHDVTLSDTPSDDQLYDIMIEAIERTTSRLQDLRPLSESQTSVIRLQFDEFLATHHDVSQGRDAYTRMFESFEQKVGELPDVGAEYERALRLCGGDMHASYAESLGVNGDVSTMTYHKSAPQVNAVTQQVEVEKPVDTGINFKKDAYNESYDGILDIEDDGPEF